MDNNNISNYDLTKVNDINTIITNENIISSSPSTINNNNNNVNNNNNYMTNNIYIDCSKKINE